ncbi:MAG: EamA family transporter [Bacteroidetes bacterium]|nr:MAG: EamA family transporter [Bacteroidota bacterium]
MPLLERGGKHTKLYANIMLLTVAIIWGSTLVVMKATTDTINPTLLIAMRFLMAGVVLGVLFFRKLLVIKRGELIGGLVIGVLLFFAHAVQTIGVTDAKGDAGRSGFLGAAYCIIVPFIYWAFERVRPDRYNIMAAVLCIAGIGLISFGGAPTLDLNPDAGLLGFTMADTLALGSAFFFAASIVAIDKYTKNQDAITITILQFFFAGIFAAIATLIREPAAVQNALWSDALWGAVLYLGLVATAFALLLQNVAQTHTDANSAAIILGTESIFCVLFGVAFNAEPMSMVLLWGFVLIFAAILISETKLSFLRRRNKENSPSVG